METLKKITNFVSKYMAAIVIAVAALALFAPNTVSFIKTSYVNKIGRASCRERVSSPV